MLRFWWPATKSQPGWWSQGCEKTDSPEWAGKVAYQKTSFSRSLIQYLPRPAHWPDAYGNWPTVRMQEIAPDAELTALRSQVEALRRALHEIAEEWAGSECGVPVHAQEAYAIGLAKRMYQLAVEGLKGQGSDSVEFDDGPIAVPMQLTVERE